MKRIFLIIFGILMVFSSHSQNNNLLVEKNTSEYFVNTLYSQIDFCYTNKSDSVYVLWIEKDNVDSLSNLKKINKHFFEIKGKEGISLMDMIWDGNVGSFTPALFDSFMKVIKPKEQFIVSFIKKGNVETDYENRIIIVNANEIRGFLTNSVILKMFNYSAKSVTILDEWLK
jgi:hypothetical protein